MEQGLPVFSSRWGLSLAERIKRAGTQESTEGERPGLACSKRNLESSLVERGIGEGRSVEGASRPEVS